MSLRARSHDGERGAVAVIVAICAVLLFGMTAYALDAGDMWQTRRHLITATDAAALAAAEKYAVGEDGCATEPETFVSANFLDASVTGCSFTEVGPGAGYVTVNAEKTVEHKFAGVLGITSSDIKSTTTASFGTAFSVTGLRPLGLCHDFPGLAEWLDEGMPTPSNPVRIDYTKESPDDCGSDAPGNWGVLDLDGGANSNRDTMNWLHDGCKCYVDEGQQIPGDTGAFSNSLSSALSYLETNAITFQLPVYSSVTGNGAIAEFLIWGFVSVVITDYRTTGPESARYITVRFMEDVAQGRCCSQVPDTGVRVVRICAVMPTFDANDCRDT